MSMALAGRSTEQQSNTAPATIAPAGVSTAVPALFGDGGPEVGYIYIGMGMHVHILLLLGQFKAVHILLTLLINSIYIINYWPQEGVK